MGNVYTIEVPSGHQLKIEADSPEEALGAANSWQPPAATATPVTASGVGAAAAGGLARGVTSLAGLPADLGDLLNRGIDKGLNAVGIQPGPLAPNVAGSQNIQKQVEKVTGEFHKPQNTTEKYIDSAASFIPGAIAAPGGAVSNAIRYGVGPGLASEAAGQAVGEGSQYEPYARAAAGIAAGAVSPTKLITPFPASDARAAALDVLKNEGVTSLTAGQKTGNLGLRNIEDAISAAPMAGGRAAQLDREGLNQFTSAVTKRAGAEGLATPEVLAANQQRLGKSFEDLASRNTLSPDNKFINDLVDSVKGYKNVPESQQKAIVQGYVGDIVDHINNGHMPGPMYQEMRSRLSDQSKSYAGIDPALSQTLGGMKSALDSAMARSISPEDASQWAQIRKEYGAQKVIEKAASRAGEATLEGNITPANLRNVVSAENRGAYARGAGQFNELARAGAQVMTPLPNSGTAQKLNAFRILDSALFGLPQAAAGRTLMNPIVQELLGNQALRTTLPKSSEAQKLLMIQMLQRSQNGQ